MFYPPDIGMDFFAEQKQHSPVWESQQKLRVRGREMPVWHKTFQNGLSMG